MIRTKPTTTPFGRKFIFKNRVVKNPFVKKLPLKPVLPEKIVEMPRIGTNVLEV